MSAISAEASPYASSPTGMDMSDCGTPDAAGYVLHRDPSFGNRVCPPTPLRPRTITPPNRTNSLVDTKMLLTTHLKRAESEVTPFEFKGEGHFVRERLIGESQSSEVYLVKSRNDGQPYALKRSRRTFTGRDDRANFLHEIESVAAMMPHDNVVKYYSGWQEEGHFWLQMEFCDGGSLRRLLSRRPPGTMLPERDLWDLLHQVATGLAHCHAYGVLHLDIKPDNIYIVLKNRGDGGQLAPVYKIGDFGNALLQGRGWLAEDGDGGYVAPELLHSEYGASPAADMYSLGATIYEVATGQRIPRGEEARRRGVPRPSTGNCGEELVAVLSELLSWDAERRPEARRVSALAAEWLMRNSDDNFACSPHHPDGCAVDVAMIMQATA